jgi:hypothetical protein
MGAWVAAIVLDDLEFQSGGHVTVQPQHLLTVPCGGGPCGAW